MLKSDVLKINAKCENNFRLNVFMAAVWKEKSLYKAIELPGTADAEHENKVVIFKLQFDEVIEGHKKIGVAPFLWLEMQHPLKGRDLASTSTLAKAQIGPTVPRKNTGTLQKLTGKFNTEICKYIYGKISEASQDNGSRLGNLFSRKETPADKALQEILKTI